jgi:hypothetical protein
VSAYFDIATPRQPSDLVYCKVAVVCVLELLREPWVADVGVVVLDGRAALGQREEAAHSEPERE